MTTLKQKIFEDCVKAEAHNPVKIIDIAISRFEKLIDEKLALIQRSSVYADGMSIILEELKEELRK